MKKFIDYLIIVGTLLILIITLVGCPNPSTPPDGGGGGGGDSIVKPPIEMSEDTVK